MTSKIPIKLRVLQVLQLYREGRSLEASLACVRDLMACEEVNAQHPNQ